MNIVKNIMRDRLIQLVLFAMGLLHLMGCSNMMQEHPINLSKTILEINLIAYYNLPVATVSGRVILCNCNNAGNPGVTVRLNGLIESFTTTTDNNGVFTFNNIRTTTFKLSMSKSGVDFNPADQNISVTTEGISNLSVNTVVTWQKNYGGSNWDRAFSVQQTGDCGYIVAGYSDSGQVGNFDLYVIKIDIFGNEVWSKKIGGTRSEYGYSVRQTVDGGYIIAGSTESYGNGLADAYVVKLTGAGDVSWQKTYGGTQWDQANAIRITADGNYVVAGYTESKGAGSRDAWVLKLGPDGTILWDYTYGGQYLDEASDIQPSLNGGYIVAGTRQITSGNNDLWMLKLTEAGTVEWEQNRSQGPFDELNAIRSTNDGGYFAVGYADASSGTSWVMKLDSTGNDERQQQYSFVDINKAYDVQQSVDGGYIVTGYAYSHDTMSNDMLLLKYSSTGDLTWQHLYDGPGLDDDCAYAIQQTGDKGFIVAGYSRSYSTKDNVYLMKLNQNGLLK